MAQAAARAEKLTNEATIGIVGGGPAGSFLAIHLLRIARRCGRRLKVLIFEHRRAPLQRNSTGPVGPYKGCPRCAGGVSPRLSEALEALEIRIPDRVLQARIRSIAVQGDWKPVILDTPRTRRMLSVFRGALPLGHGFVHESFDALLQDSARSLGAALIGARVTRVVYGRDGRPVISHETESGEAQVTVDFVAFAGGVNERSDPRTRRPASGELFQMLQPGYVPPRQRKALIVELSAPPDCDELEESRLHLIEGSVSDLRLEMCSIMPKRGYFTISMIGKSVDESTSHKDNLALIHRFLASPRVRRILPAGLRPAIRCVCNPTIVVGTARRPWAHRAAVVGDMATSRQYKDGMLAAHDTARDLAGIVLERGIDIESLASGYAATLARFRRDNRYASLIFSMYRWFYTRRLWSRIIYQTLASERKRERPSQRRFERIFWAISSGDRSYEEIAWAMVRPATAWKIFRDGICITARNRLVEAFFGVDWADIGRFPTAVPLEQLRTRRMRLMGGRRSEFECTYTIGVRAGVKDTKRILAEFGEPSRPYLNPRWVSIARIGGEPLEPGWRIRYRILGGLLAFEIVQESRRDDNDIRFRVAGGFADGGTFVFSTEPAGRGHCALSVFLAFDYRRGETLPGRLLCAMFQHMFPEFIHDVLWNHALCEIRQRLEERLNDGIPEPAD